MKRAGVVALVVAAFASTGGVAVAQPVPFYPGGGAPEAPRVLDPGAEGSQAKQPAKPAQPATPQGPQQPNVVVVRPDGSVSYGPGDQGSGPGGYYVDSGGSPTPRDTEVHAGPVPELHVVRRGDTLWDICWYYFNDPWQWPKVWSYNAQITNPHWIYPGDLVRLLPRGVFAQQPGSGEPDKATEPNKAPDRLPPPQKRLDVGIKQTAFVEKRDLEQSMQIVGSVDEKELLGINDSVYISYPDGKPPEVGKTYSLYKPGNPVKGASGKTDVGAFVHVLGAVQIQSVRQDKRARGVITESNQEIERGTKVGPLIKEFKNVPPVPPKVDAQGSIVAMLKAEQLIGQGEVVFIDLGKGSGIEVGNRMFVVRRGDAKPPQMSNHIGQDDRQFPARALGEVVLVEVGENISIGLVTLSVQEMGVGDLVIMQKAK